MPRTVAGAWKATVHGVSSGKNSGVGCYSLLQRIFPTQGLNPGLLHYRRILYHLSCQGSPRIAYTGESNSDELKYLVSFKRKRLVLRDGSMSWISISAYPSALWSTWSTGYLGDSVTSPLAQGKLQPLSRKTTACPAVLKPSYWNLLPFPLSNTVGTEQFPKSNYYKANLPNNQFIYCLVFQIYQIGYFLI